MGRGDRPRRDRDEVRSRSLRKYCIQRRKRCSRALWVALQMPLSLAGRKVLKQVLALPENRQLEIFRTLASRTHSRQSMPTGTEVREQRFRTDISCPHCKRTHVHRHGKYSYE